MADVGPYGSAAAANFSRGRSFRARPLRVIRRIRDVGNSDPPEAPVDILTGKSFWAYPAWRTKEAKEAKATGIVISVTRPRSQQSGVTLEKGICARREAA